MTARDDEGHLAYLNGKPLPGLCHCVLNEAHDAEPTALLQGFQAMGRVLADWLERWSPVFEQMTEVLNRPEVRAAIEQRQTWRPCRCFCLRGLLRRPGNRVPRGRFRRPARYGLASCPRRLRRDRPDHRLPRLVRGTVSRGR